VGKGAHGGTEALVSEHDRLEVERKVADRADRVPVQAEGIPEYLGRVLEPAVLDRMDRRIEHERDPGQGLDRSVVQLEGDPAPLVLLRCDQALGELLLVGAGQSMIASRSAIATACVRVSASSFVRMWRTWLFTVSWLMKSFPATSAFDIPSASSWRISRSRPVSMSSPFPGRNAGISAGST